MSINNLYCLSFLSVYVVDIHWLYPKYDCFKNVTIAFGAITGSRILLIIFMTLHILNVTVHAKMITRSYIYKVIKFSYV